MGTHQQAVKKTNKSLRTQATKEEHNNQDTTKKH